MNQKEYNKEVKHTGRQKCCKCDHKSLSGFIKGKGHCRYHWNLLQGWIKPLLKE